MRVRQLTIADSPKGKIKMSETELQKRFRENGNVCPFIETCEGYEVCACNGSKKLFEQCFKITVKELVNWI